MALLAFATQNATAGETIVVEVGTETGTYTRYNNEEGQYGYQYACAWTSTEYDTKMLEAYQAGKTDPYWNISVFDGRQVGLSDGDYTLFAPEGYVITGFRLNEATCLNQSAKKITVKDTGEEFEIEENGSATITVTGLSLESVTFNTVETSHPYMLTVVGGIDIMLKKGESDDTTGITMPEKKTASDGKMYDLTGRLIDNPTKGIFIKNGKKYIIK